MGFTRPLTEMSTRSRKIMFLGSKLRTMRRADNLAAIREQCWILDISQPYRLPRPVAEIVLTPWSESASELYRPRDRRLSAKLVPIFADRGCHVVSVTDPYGRFLAFLDRSNFFLPSSSSTDLTRPSGTRFRPTTSQKKLF
jgi:hypothetical protein